MNKIERFYIYNREIYYIRKIIECCYQRCEICNTIEDIWICDKIKIINNKINILFFYLKKHFWQKITKIKVLYI
jgi:hypothetical protein